MYLFLIETHLMIIGVFLLVHYIDLNAGIFLSVLVTDGSLVPPVHLCSFQNMK